MNEVHAESRISLAYKYMVSKHGLQKRKTGELYVEHPKRVAALAMQYKAGSWQIENIIIACLLHDIVEDTNGTVEEIRELFGDMVASIVEEVTSISRAEMEEKGVAKADYLSQKMVAMTEYGLVVKLLDRLSNVETLGGTEDIFKYRQIKDTEYILEHLLINRTFTTLTHHQIIAQIKIELDKFKPKTPLGGN
jgi:guanosine-3',5'-bis(diphosphate) 3'-pyrophosphohydrolase